MADIVVYGRRIDYGGGGGATFYLQEAPGEGGDIHPTLEPGGEGGGPIIPSEPTDFDPPQVAAEVTIAANAAKVQAAAKKMIDQVTRLTPMIDALPNNAVITFKNGATMTGAELKDWWRRANFLVTDRNDFGMDRAGAVVGTLSQFNANAVLGWDARPNGLAFIMLHEILHMTPAARAYDEQMWLIHHNAGGTAQNYDGSVQSFRQNEQFVNDAAQQILAKFPPGNTLTVNTSDPDPRRWVPPWGM